MPAPTGEEGKALHWHKCQSDAPPLVVVKWCRTGRSRISQAFRDLRCNCAGGKGLTTHYWLPVGANLNVAVVGRLRLFLFLLLLSCFAVIILLNPLSLVHLLHCSQYWELISFLSSQTWTGIVLFPPHTVTSSNVISLF